MKNVKKVVLAYSGGLDTSIILQWLKERYGCKVVAWCADVGQAEELDGLEAKAKATGADEYVQMDLREPFVRDFVYPAFRANAIYEGEYLLGTSLARPCIIEGMMKAVAATGADAIAHGATGKGNDQVRFELGAMYIDPAVKVIAPWREWDLKSRTDCIEFAKARNIPVPVTTEKPYSMDRNLLHISYEGGVLEDPWNAPKKEMFLLTTDPTDAPNEPEEIVIGFEKGDPVSINGDALGPVALLTRLNELAGKHGVGRVDIVESRYVGMKSRGVYETPGGTILHKAHRAMESITLDREQIRLRDAMVPEYSTLVYRGFWFSPEREMLQAMVDATQTKVTGEVRVRLYKGSVTVTGRRSPYSLYREEFSTFEKDEVYNQSDATGFIRLTALRLRLEAMRNKG